MPKGGQSLVSTRRRRGLPFNVAGPPYAPMDRRSATGPCPALLWDGEASPDFDLSSYTTQNVLCAANSTSRSAWRAA